MDLFEHKPQAAKLQAAPWRQLPFDFGGPPQSGHIHWRPGCQAVLVLDGYVDTIALSGPEFGSTAALTVRAGQPHTIQAAPDAQLWRYGNWGVTVRDGQVEEAWVVRAVD